MCWCSTSTNVDEKGLPVWLFWSHESSTSLLRGQSSGLHQENWFCEEMRFVLEAARKIKIYEAESDQRRTCKRLREE